MFDLQSALRRVIEIDGSDLHLKVPSQPLIRRLGHLEPIPGSDGLTPEDTEGALRELLTERAKLEEFADGLAYPPPRALIAEGLPFLAAGPGPGIRGARVDAIFKKRHPHEPHVYLWQLAAHPSAQRQGVGRALMARVLEEAQRRDLPTYLETTKPENVPYYGSFGFRVVDEADLPRGAHVWFMLRDRSAL